MRFTYRTGERPLAGFTVKRGVGKGGFGEVYFAVSDSGKEVALKLLRGSSDVELRGVANCLNLKHPNLVHIYDLKEDSHGDKWLVMEYVLGESLANVIDRHPNGLPVNLAVEWFQALARAVGYLHDHGVVHRDIKPANVFLEHGSLKVGDYGLCKSINQSARQHTRSVGTVHYMAPEIASGNYSKAIDIYACGVVLHEMLTGKLPFDGETDAEILMKHLTATPDVSKVPEAFQSIIAKALEKNPLQRYGSMMEVARAVDAAYPTQLVAPAPPLAHKPSSPPAPVTKTESQRVEAPVAVPVAMPVAQPIAAPVAQPAPAMKPLAAPVATTDSRSTFRDRLTDTTGAMVQAPFVVGAAMIPWMAITRTGDWAAIGKMGLVSLALAWAWIFASSGVAFKAADTWMRRLWMAMLGALIGGMTFWLDGWIGPTVDPSDDATGLNTYFFGMVGLPPRSVPILAGYALYFGCILGAARWWRMAAKDRKDRFSTFPPIVAAFWGAVLSFLWPWDAGTPTFGIIALVMATVAVQWVCPWVPPPPKENRKLRWKAA